MARAPASVLTAQLGAIGFLNTLPIYRGLKQIEQLETPTCHWQITYDTPAQLNRRMRAGELAVSAISSACYVRNAEQFVLLEDLSVSSYGAVESVLFLSPVGLSPDLLKAPVIYVPDDSETSVAILAWILTQIVGEQDWTSRFKVYAAHQAEQYLAQGQPVLMIGDRALMLCTKGIPSGYQALDLATLWAEKTGLPVVFAVWVAQKTWAKQHPEALQEINHWLCRQRDNTLSNLTTCQQLAEQALKTLPNPRPEQPKTDLLIEVPKKVLGEAPGQTLVRYWRQSLDYRLGPKHRQALQHLGEIVGQQIIGQVV